MKKVKIETDKYIISYDKKYYVVNNYTLKLFEALEKTNDINELSNILKIKKQRIKTSYNKLNKALKSIDYYDNNIELKAPLKIQWKVTPYCNLKCIHCYIGDIEQKTLNRNELLDITKKIIDAGVMEVTLTGGEALTVDCLDEIVQKLNNNGIEILIFTNGILLKNFIDKINNNVDKSKIRFSISVDGTKEIHEKIRGKDTFIKTIEGIKYALQNGYDVVTNTVLSTINYKNFPMLYSQLYELGVKKIQISNIIDSGRANSSMKLSKEQNQEFIILLKDEIKKIEDNVELLYASMPDEQDSQSDIYLIKKDNIDYMYHEKWKCSAGIGKATIDFSGKVYCCPFLENSYLGNIKEKDIKDIWDSQKRYEFLKFISINNNNSRVCIVAKKRMERS